MYSRPLFCCPKGSDDMEIIKPQKGPQEKFLSSPADIVIYGGAAGGGKTYALLMEPLRHMNNGGFGTVFFRRNMKQITNEGGLWDTAKKVYLPIGAFTKLSPTPTIIWPSGAKITFSHLQMQDDVLSWQGSQICLICFDELTHFTESQFWYMLSRNRSTCGVRPYIRATTNPDVNSWVAKLIEWWIDQQTGYPIPERSGVIRYFYRYKGNLIWGKTRDDVAEKAYLTTDEQRRLIKSFTFIASNVYDNKILLEKDPGYLANLTALSTVDRERLLHGNWLIRPAAGLIFNRTQVNFIDAAPKLLKLVRKWDLAATEPSETNKSPDATAGVLMGVDKDKNYYILDVVHRRENAANVRKLVLATAQMDKEKYRNVKINISQDPGQAGKEQAQSYIKMLSGFKVVARQETGDKVTRAEPFAAQWQAGNVYLVKGAWNESYIDELERFPEGEHDDQVDASSGAFNELARSGGMQINKDILRPRGSYYA